MDDIRWELYPLVAASERGRHWLQLQSHLQLAPKTIDAYGRSLNDFLTFCQRSGMVPETITREQVGLYVHDLAHRSNPKGAHRLFIASGRGLSNSTMQQRFFEFQTTPADGEWPMVRGENPALAMSQKTRLDHRLDG